jgi:hypothetical protein
MTKKTLECNNCSIESTIEYDYDSTGEEPIYCPFCGSSYIQEELEDFDLLKDDFDDMDAQW